MKYKVEINTIVNINVPVNYTPGQIENAIRKQIIKGIKEGSIKLHTENE